MGRGDEKSAAILPHFTAIWKPVDCFVKQKKA